MSKLEKFGLVTGIIGLVADCIALLVFLSGIWTPTSPKTTPVGCAIMGCRAWKPGLLKRGGPFLSRGAN
jgi:hypothetical protein